MSVVETKSLLAKLLAEENISVEHRKTQTAYFNVKDRVLVCPIMKDMPAELYDLLMGHEVGHALYTPSEGWHNAVANDKRPNFKSFLNVVEDARIERFIKNKFPGIRPSFFKGYKNLLDRDFFGVNNRDLETLPLIDRINLHFKLGTMASVSFDADEMPFVEMVDEVETWEDVVRVANALYQHAKENPQQPESSTSEGDEFDFSDDDDLGDQFEESFDDLDKEFQDQDGQEGEEEESSDSQDSAYRQGSSSPSSPPDSITDRNFRNKEQELVDDSCMPIVYVDMPQLNMTKRIVSYKQILAHLDGGVFYSSEINASEVGMSVREFNEKNSRYINYLLKEFELRKNASQFARAAVNKTGQLDMQKISKYRLSEDLFKRVTIVPQGKSHGLVMFLDYSSSMTNILNDTIEQLLIVTTFCRKANIPFSVYAFSDNEESFKALCGEDASALPLQAMTDKEIAMGTYNPFFHLKEYLSSAMSKAEYNKGMQNLLTIGGAYARGYKQFLHATERLRGTPLNGAILVSSRIVNNFRKAHKLEVVSAMFLTDGQSNHESEFYFEGGSYKGFRQQIAFCYNYKVTVTDRFSRASVTISNDDCLTKAYLMLAKKITGANYIGFFIGQRGYPMGSTLRDVAETYRPNNPLSEEEKKLANKHKFCALTDTGFDVYYVVKGEELRVQNSSLSVSHDASKSELRKAFSSTMNSRASNRVFLSRFCNTLCSQL